MSNKIIGIDLGTTNSCVSVMEGDKPIVIANSNGERTTPSIVYIKDGVPVVGNPARRQALANPRNTIYGIKRFMGSQFNSPEVQKNLKHISYDVIKSSNGDAWVKIEGKEYSPEQISAMILASLKKAAEDYLGHAVTEAVVTVPAYFNDKQRQATKDAGKIAGLDVKRIINEPTAAALAYGLDKQKSGKIAVYDLGGGTFDVSILEIEDGVFEVKSTSGDTFLGGEDFDNLLTNHIVDEFKKQHGVDLKTDPKAVYRIKEAAEKAKKELSSTESTHINLPYIYKEEHLDLQLSRAKLEKLVDSLIEQTKASCEKALKDSGFNKNEIDEVILVGGMTRMPKVQKFVEQVFGKAPSKGVNPDEVVADGAAIQAGILSGSVRDIVLVDVLPLSLGIETMGGVFTPIVEKNTPTPAKKSQIFSTAADNQTAVEIMVYQGERTMAKDNKLLGRFVLDGIPPAPRGMPQVEVTFDTDANSILHVSAKDKTTGKEQKVTIHATGGLTKSDIDRMVKESEAHQDEDKKLRELIEIKNQSENLIYSTEKSLKEHEDKVSEEDKQAINASKEELHEAMKSDNPETIKAALDRFAQASMKIGEAVYKQQQQANQGDNQQGGNDQEGSGNQNNPTEEKVVEGEKA